MKKLLLGLFFAASFAGNAQTDGTLTFSFTPTSHNGYSGTKNVLAVWIQDASGNFVKTKLRYVGSGTADHLPTWAVNSGGSSWNATSSSCNTTDATTGATLTSFTTKTITWDGKNVNGTSNGTTVADGTYKVTIESTWNHGSSNHVTRSFTFTKGPNSDSQTPADDANFTNISLTWTPAPASVENNTTEFPAFDLYPNPASDLVTLNYTNAQSVKIINELGDLVYTTNLTYSVIGTKTIDMSSFARGMYHVLLVNDKGTIAKKVILK